jgi:hypothetical protein
MIAMAAFVCTLVAFILFGVATDRHHERHFGCRPQPGVAQRCRTAAWTSLVVGLGAALASWGTVFGTVAWIGLVMAGAAASFLLLNFSPQADRTRQPTVTKRRTSEASEN